MLFPDFVLNRLKNLTKILICFCLVYTPFFANASSNVGGWSMGNPVAEGASAVYTGTKNVIINGADYIKKGTAKITPTASQVAKVLRGGVAGYALSIAVEQLLGSVDWVLDPANNRIKYYEDPVDPPHLFLNPITADYTKPVSASSACNIYGNFQVNGKYWKSFSFTVTGSLKDGYKCSFSVLNKYDVNQQITYQLQIVVTNPEAEREEKYLPLSTVAQQVISNAEGGDTNAQVATMAAAADIVDEASKDETKAPPIVGQLEASAKTTPADAAAADTAGTGTGTQTKDPANPDVTNLTLEFPIFCNWAPSVCEAAQVVISFPQTLTSWWETSTKAISEAWIAVKEYFKEETQEKENTEVDIEEIPDTAEKVTVSIGDDVCPSLPVNIRTPFRDNAADLSPTYLCQQAQMIKTFFIALGFWTASMIVGRRQ